MSGGGDKKAGQKSPPINAKSGDEEKFIQYVEIESRPMRGIKTEVFEDSD